MLYNNVQLEMIEKSWEYRAFQYVLELKLCLKYIVNKFMVAVRVLNKVIWTAN